MVRQHFTEPGHADAPVARHGQRLLQVGTDVQLGDLARPAGAAGTALVTEPAQVAALVGGHVAEPRNVETAGTTTEVVLVFVALDPARGARTEMMVHHVVPELTRRRAQPPSQTSVAEFISSRVELNDDALRKMTLAVYW